MPGRCFKMVPLRKPEQQADYGQSGDGIGSQAIPWRSIIFALLRHRVVVNIGDAPACSRDRQGIDVDPCSKHGHHHTLSCRSGCVPLVVA